ncbi:hypothetical protein HNP77_002270 [Treponema rectale]|uniref:Uncharacterized protein n=1 Tax=Treponema rectale TaxID=744512 RepID=A0A840SKK1_9SPIR|nr:hypothetical protein [Treponema rectale]MBB5219881.1 hypothetical protein [Treponema rectale]
MKVLTEERIRNSIQKFYSSIQNDENARYKSWEHCYKIFEDKQGKNDSDTIDLLSLNLAFYLASWGMYRGSSFLLQKDYKVHKDAVIEMQKPKYNILRAATPEILITDEALLKICELQYQLGNVYTKVKKTVVKSKTAITDTLITKILMGVFGCIPAYDRYVKYSLKEYGIGTPFFTNPVVSLKELYNFYIENKNVLDEEREKINTHGIIYPHMKVIDILLWQIGFDNDIKGKLKKADEV